MTQTNQPTLEQVIAWAKEAGKIVHEKFNDRHTIGYKGEVDVVTEADKASEAYILEQIHKHFPGHAIITEETGEYEGDLNNCWIIDPLDGTVNYSHRLPIYSICIAFRHNGELTLGVVFDPSLDECFSAEKGKGAYLNGQPIQVSKAEKLIGTLLVSGFPYDRTSDDYFRALRLFGHMTTISQGVRRLGSAALDMCYVACGRIDAYWELSIKLWDIAASSLIVLEAGGTVRGIKGQADFLVPPYALIASGPGVYDELLGEILKTP